LEATDIISNCKKSITKSNFISCTGGTTCNLTGKININGSQFICPNDSVLISAEDIGSNYSYVWIKDGFTLYGKNTSSIYAKTGGNYKVSINNGSCSIISDEIDIYEFTVPTPVISSIGVLEQCSNTSMNLFTTTVYQSYKWSNNDTNPSISVSNGGYYSVSVTDINGCNAASAPYEVNTSIVPKPEICIVTVDKASGKNLVVWERKTESRISHYVIYKLNGANYDSIGYKPYNEVSVFEDMLSQPEKRAEKYKIAIRDNCGNLGAKSSETVAKNHTPPNLVFEEQNFGFGQ